MSVKFLTPKNGEILTVGQECSVQVQQQEATTVTLYMNDKVVAESGSSLIPPE